MPYCCRSTFRPGSTIRAGRSGGIKGQEGNGRALIAHWRATSRPIIHVRHDWIGDPAPSLAPGQPGKAFRERLRAAARAAEWYRRASIRPLSAPISICGCAGSASTPWSRSASRPTCACRRRSGWARTWAGRWCSCLTHPTASTCPTEKADIIPARAIHDAHVATLGFEFCDLISTAERAMARRAAACPKALR